MRAIQTEYDGKRFRSRLEARWAVFFNNLGINYEYEPEGFELESGHRYLPDFLLKDDNGNPSCWIEIKGKLPELEEIYKIHSLCANQEIDGFIFFGKIDNLQYVDVSSDVIFPIIFFESNKLEIISFKIKEDEISDFFIMYSSHTGDTSRSIEAATRSRFEFGEKP